MRTVFLESPFAGETPAIKARNLEYARKCVRDCLERGDSPYASHLLLTQEGILNDDIPEERSRGIGAGQEWLKLAEASVVYYDRGISKGMTYGIETARSWGIPVEFRRLRTPEVFPGDCIRATEILSHTLAGRNNRCSVKGEDGNEYTVVDAYHEDIEAAGLPFIIKPLSDGYAITHDGDIKSQTKWPFCPHHLLPIDQRAEIEAKEAADLASGAMTLNMCSLEGIEDGGELLWEGRKIEAKTRPLRHSDGTPVKFTSEAALMAKNSKDQEDLVFDAVEYDSKGRHVKPSKELTDLFDKVPKGIVLTAKEAEERDCKDMMSPLLRLIAKAKRGGQK